nr:hypothetical protein Q903MT_gene2248 [Picea sitchensis]
MEHTQIPKPMDLGFRALNPSSFESEWMNNTYLVLPGYTIPFLVQSKRGAPYYYNIIRGNPKLQIEVIRGGFPYNSPMAGDR